MQKTTYLRGIAALLIAGALLGGCATSTPATPESAPTSAPAQTEATSYPPPQTQPEGYPAPNNQLTSPYPSPTQ